MITPLSLLGLVPLIPLVISRTITVKNSCQTEVWPGLHTGNDTTIPNQITGWKLGRNQQTSFQVSDAWTAGRIWGRTGCTTNDQGLFVCLTGSCGDGKATDATCYTTNEPPATLAEFTLSPNGEDNYDISLVDGYNLPLNIYPSEKSCMAPTCEGNINKYCPDVLRTGLDQHGINLGCLAPCNAGFGDELYGNRACCTGAYGNNSMLCESCGMDYYDMFKDNCQFSYAYAYDEKSGTALHTCNSTLQADYTIEFCPKNADYFGQLKPDPQYLASTASCSSIATTFNETFSIRPSPTSKLTSGTLSVIATVATGVDGAAALQVSESQTTSLPKPGSGYDNTQSAPTQGSNIVTGSQSNPNNNGQPTSQVPGAAGQVISVPAVTGAVVPSVPINNNNNMASPQGTESSPSNLAAQQSTNSASSNPSNVPSENVIPSNPTSDATHPSKSPNNVPSNTNTVNSASGNPNVPGDNAVQASLNENTLRPSAPSGNIAYQPDPSANQNQHQSSAPVGITSSPNNRPTVTSTRSHLVTITTTLPDGSPTSLSFATTQGKAGYTSAFAVVDGNTLYQVGNGNGASATGEKKTCKAPAATNKGGQQGQWLKSVPKRHNRQRNRRAHLAH